MKIVYSYYRNTSPGPQWKWSNEPRSPIWWWKLFTQIIKMHPLDHSENKEVTKLSELQASLCEKLTQIFSSWRDCVEACTAESPKSFKWMSVIQGRRAEEGLSTKFTNYCFRKVNQRNPALLGIKQMSISHWRMASLTGWSCKADNSLKLLEITRLFVSTPCFSQHWTYSSEQMIGQSLFMSFR